MKNQIAGSSVFNPGIFVLLFSIVTLLTLASTVYASAKHYAGNGISFDYPDNYSLTTSSKKSSEKIHLKNGMDSISIQVMKNELIDNFDEIVTSSLRKQFKAEGREISGTEKEKKMIPLKVKGESTPLNIDAVKYSHVVNVEEKDISLKLKQTMFFFSYNGHGYMINYTRNNGKYIDLVDVLSSFSFDRKEQAENDEKAAVY